MAVAIAVAASVVASASENLLPALLLSAFLVTPMLLFGTMTVTITDEAIVLRFGVGLLRRRIPVTAVRSYERVRNPWYYGWGVHTIPDGWLYNASGFEAVDLSLADGTHVRIGTNEPDAVVDTLRRVVSNRAAPDAEVDGSHASHVNPIVAMLAFLFVPVFVVVALMFYVSTKPVTVTVSRDQLSFSGGIYRDDILLKNVESVSLEPVLPAVLARTNGFAFGNSLRGRFRLQDLGNADLFVEAGRPPFVRVQTTTTLVWVNFKDQKRTRDLYVTLAGAAPKSR